MISRTVLALGACLSLASLSVSAQIKVDGDVETEGDGYINVGGLVLKTGLGECLKTGTNSEDNMINKCAGIDDEEAVAAAEGAASDAEEKLEEVAKAPVAPAAPTQTAKIDTRQFSEQVLFDTDSSSLNAAGQSVMSNLFSALSEYKGITGIMVVGHSDNTGDEAYNMALSEQRAATVAANISDKYPGVRIDVEGMGESQPIASNDSAEGRQMNRRVDVEITATRMIFN